LFSDDLSVLQRDFILIQQLLGQKGLSVNPAKTSFRDKEEASVEYSIDAIRAGLLRKRAVAFRSLYEEEEEPDEEVLTDEESYLLALLDSPKLDEEGRRSRTIIFARRGQ
jgi:hypothetical protein